MDQHQQDGDLPAQSVQIKLERAFCLLFRHKILYVELMLPYTNHRFLLT
jgi:hypothetical protein